jgi:hypothetical protein
MRRIGQGLAIAGVSVVVALGPSHPGAGAGELRTTSSAVAPDTVACPPVGEGRGNPVTVTLSEWTVSASPESVPAGKTDFRASNKGAEVHELVVVKGDDAAALPVKEGAVDEEALPKEAFSGEIEDVPAGGACQGSFELAAGPYILFCNIVERESNGELESHYLNGMRTAFTVAPRTAAAAAPGPLPRTGEGSHGLVLLSGLLLAVGGLGVTAGARRSQRRA